MTTKKEKERNYSYDLARVTFCICIILIHTTSFFYKYPTNSFLWWTGNIIRSVVLIGLPMFVVLSGALILNSKEEPIGIFYKKRLKRILIPYFLYHIIYFVFNIYYAVGEISISKIPNYILKIIKGPIYEHLWFVYMIIGLYLCSPFLKKMCKNMNEKDLNNLFYFLTSVIIIRNLLPLININIGITDIIFEGWITYYLLGYIMTNTNLFNNHKNIFYFLGIISLIISIIENRYHLLNISSLYTFSILMYFQVIVVFMFFTNLKLNLDSKKRKILLTLSKYSFEVYIVHGAIMNLLSRANSRLNLFNEGLLYNILFIFFVILFSYITAFIMHNILVQNTEKIILKVAEKFKKRKLSND